MFLLLAQLAALPPCPVAEVVLALPRGAPIPHEWVRIYLGGECSGPGSPELQNRVKNDTATMQRVIRILRGKESDSTLIRGNALWMPLRRVSEDGPPTTLDIMLRYSERPPATYAEAQSSGGYFEAALQGLARYAATSQPARRRIERHLRSDIPEVRQEAFHTLFYINNEWARTLAASVPGHDLGFYDQYLLASILKEPACPARTFWSECHGVEGQVYRKCAPWPIPCRIDKFGV